MILPRKPRREMLFSDTGYALLTSAALVPVKNNRPHTQPLSCRYLTELRRPITPSYADLSTTNNDVSKEFL